MRGTRYIELVTHQDPCCLSSSFNKKVSFKSKYLQKDLFFLSSEFWDLASPVRIGQDHQRIISLLLTPPGQLDWLIIIQCN